jgi:hypothetical protein
VQWFRNLYPNKKLTIFALIILVFIASIVFGIMINKRGSKVANTPSETEKTSTGQVKQGETALKMMVDPSSMAVNGTAKVTVMLENTAVQATDIASSQYPQVPFETSHQVR